MKFELEINMDNMNEKGRLHTIITLLRDVVQRLDTQRRAGGAGEGVIFDDDDSAIGSFGIV